MMLEALAAMFGLGGLVIGRGLSRRSKARADARRFVLRVRHRGGDTVLLGRRAAGGDVRDHVLESAELLLVDDAENRILIPAGLRLTLRDFDAGEWGGPDGEDFMLLPHGPFWVLDAPPWTGCHLSKDAAVHVLPERDYTLTTRGPDARHAIAIVATTSDPIWDTNLATLSWMLPPRAPTALPVVVFSFADPRRARDRERSDAVRGAALVLADELFRKTDAPVSMAFHVLVGQRLADIAPAPPSWDEIVPFLERLGHPHAVIRGEVIGDEVRVTVRVVAEEEERVLEGALHRIADELAELLEDRGVCRRRQPPEEMRIPASAMLAYERAAALAFESLLADDRNQAIVAVPGRAGAAAAAARDLAASHPGSRVLQLLWASTAIRADDADELSDEDWDRLTDRCDDVTDWLFPISPLLLRRLESDGAEERRQELLASRPATYRSPPDPFAAWLEGLDLEPDDDGDDAP